MWFLIALLVVLWLIGFISFGASAVWVHVLLLAAVILFVTDAFRGRRSSE